jgi:hypothetical protein
MAKEPTIVNDAPESAPSARGRHPHLYGTLVGLGVFAVVAAPAAMTALGAVVSFTGCFVGCSEPKPVAGVFAALLVLVFLALPVIAGVLTARAISRRDGSVRALKVFALAVLLGMAAMRIIPMISRAF